MRMPTLGSLLLALSAAPAPADPPAPCVGAGAADNEFHRISAADMKVIAAKKILLATRSFGQNMLDGIDRLKAKDPMYGLHCLRNTVNLLRDAPDSLPTNAFTRCNVLHYLCSVHPQTKRLEELDRYLRSAPYEFGRQIDLAMVDFSSVGPDAFEPYAATFDALRRDFPAVTFVMVTGGLHPAAGPEQEQSWAFSDLVMKRYGGVVPILDWRDLLSTRPDGTGAGRQMVPEFNAYPKEKPDGTHPNAAFAEERLGRAFLVLLWKIYCEPGLVANAGFDRRVPDNAGDGRVPVTLDGSGSGVWGQHSRGRIVRYRWQEGERVLADGADASARVTLSVGEHTLTLTITSDASPPATRTDTVMVTVTGAGGTP